MFDLKHKIRNKESRNQRRHFKTDIQILKQVISWKKKKKNQHRIHVVLGSECIKQDVQ